MNVDLLDAQLLDIMGSDLTVVNAARVSFAAESDEFDKVFWTACVFWGFMLVLLYVNLGITSQPIGVM